MLGVKTTSHTTVTLDVNGETRTFADGAEISLPRNMGGKRRFTIDRVDFVGYGLDAPAVNHMDYRGKDVRNAAVVWIGANGPKGLDPAFYRRLAAGRNRYATEQMGAAAAIGVATPAGGRGRAGDGGRGGALGGSSGAGSGRGSALPAADFTTVQRLDTPVPPAVTADDSFLEFLFSRAPSAYAELKQKAAAQEPLPSFALDGVKITFDIDAEYQVVRTQLAHNVVAVVEGSDAQLKNTYVAFGAHYDHVGYAEGELVGSGSSARRAGARGRVTPGSEDDRIWNGADDDGSGQSR